MSLKPLYLDIFWSISFYIYFLANTFIYTMLNPGQISFPLYVYAGPINRRSTLSLPLLVLLLDVCLK